MKRVPVSRKIAVSAALLVLLFSIAAVGNPLAALLFGRDSGIFVWTNDARGTVATTAVVVAVAFGVGTAFGGAAALGPPGGDALLSLLMEVGGSLPSVVAVVALRASMPAMDLVVIGVVLAVLRGLSTAKVVRADILQLETTDFVAAARALGSGRTRLFRKHLFRYVAGPALANATFTASAVVGLDAALTFLGLGSRETSWGAAVANAALAASPASALAPLLGVAALLSSLHVLSDAVETRFSLGRRFV